jgi:hypothetical protein
MKNLSLGLLLIGALNMSPFFSIGQDVSLPQEPNRQEQFAPKGDEDSDLPPPPPFSLEGDKEELKRLDAFPNPGNGELTLQLTDGRPVEITVLDLSGTVHFQKSAVPNHKFQLKLNLSNAQSGIYLIRVDDYCFKYQKW